MRATLSPDGRLLSWSHGYVWERLHPGGSTSWNAPGLAGSVNLTAVSPQLEAPSLARRLQSPALSVPPASPGLSGVMSPTPPAGSVSLGAVRSMPSRSPSPAPLLPAALRGLHSPPRVPLGQHSPPPAWIPAQVNCGCPAVPVFQPTLPQSLLLPSLSVRSVPPGTVSTMAPGSTLPSCQGSVSSAPGPRASRAGSFVAPAGLGSPLSVNVAPLRRAGSPALSRFSTPNGSVQVLPRQGSGVLATTPSVSLTGSCAVLAPGLTRAFSASTPSEAWAPLRGSSPLASPGSTGKVGAAARAVAELLAKSRSDVEHQWCRLDVPERCCETSIDQYCSSAGRSPERTSVRDLSQAFYDRLERELKMAAARRGRAEPDWTDLERSRDREPLPSWRSLLMKDLRHSSLEDLL